MAKAVAGQQRKQSHRTLGGIEIQRCWSLASKRGKASRQREGNPQVPQPVRPEPVEQTTTQHARQRQVSLKEGFIFRGALWKVEKERHKHTIRMKNVTEKLNSQMDQPTDRWSAV
ncbi:DNA replication licensing factor MCM3-like protein [Anopheles sinensis]|uniref:DNA replication licensing factor MCM3-like protein n=1 Tax=Anopheles sinensis TaxID=74873 RepID=A0A084WQ78_ANOSI|nr:DNA replication licensing factor MCM3-like protein [Anopheles sinensis]